jgi:hypothetical protein
VTSRLGLVLDALVVVVALGKLLLLVVVMVNGVLLHVDPCHLSLALLVQVRPRALHADLLRFFHDFFKTLSNFSGQSTPFQPGKIAITKSTITSPITNSFPSKIHRNQPMIIKANAKKK